MTPHWKVQTFDSIPSPAQDGSYQVELPAPAFVQQRGEEGDTGIRSPKYPSTVVRVSVQPGQEVSKGAILMTVEGMKMEVRASLRT